MKFKKMKLKTVRFKDNYNFKVEDLFEVNSGVYKIYDKIIMIQMMYRFGIYCGIERRIKNKNVIPFINNRPMTDSQLEFIRKRAIALEPTINVQDTRQECGCKKQKEM